MDTIPADPYVKQGFRFKSIGWFRIKHHKAKPDINIENKIKLVNEKSGLTTGDKDKSADWTLDGYDFWHLPQYGMQQSSAYNPVHGDLCRYYPSIPSSMVQRSDFRDLLLLYAKFFQWEDEVVLLQFQRIDALPQRPGIPAVEGTAIILYSSYKNAMTFTLHPLNFPLNDDLFCETNN